MPSRGIPDRPEGSSETLQLRREPPQQHRAATLGGRLRAAAKLPVLAPHRPALLGLALVLDEQEGLDEQDGPDERDGPDEQDSPDERDGPERQDALRAPAESWAQLDLLRAHGRPETFARLPEPRWARGVRWAELAPPVLVFVPLGITWLGLSRATGAYQQLRSTPEGRKLADRQSFLELWQDGFQGRLHWLAFGSMAWWTLSMLIVIALLVLATGWVRRHTEQRNELAVRHAAALLTPLLTEAQLRINTLRWESPARLAGELGRGAATLGDLLRSTRSSQEAADTALAGTAATLRSVQELVTRVGRATPALADSAADVRKAIDALRTAQREGVAATAAAGEQQRAALEKLVSAAQSSLERAERQNAQVAAVAARRLEQAGDAVAALVRSAGAANEAALSEVGSRSAATLEGVQAGLHSAVSALHSSGRDLGAAGESLGGWVRETTDQGVARMARAFQLAISAAAVDLAVAVEETGRAQSERIERISQVVDRFDALLLAEADRRSAALDGLAAGAAELRAAAAALERSAAGPAEAGDPGQEAGWTPVDAPHDRSAADGAEPAGEQL
ncbi:hypothetical protein ACIQGZ_10840 [Streptomyces sp. NPDC092296]|uniref:hypothetical protein n=1 Tax=Streptomyces sp. NPDC092296 TaxID=3366012 RepID=UPI0038235AE3